MSNKVLSAPAQPAILSSRWHELRGPDGRFLAKYDPQRGLIAIPHRGKLLLFDLTEVEEPIPA